MRFLVDKLMRYYRSWRKNRLLQKIKQLVTVGEFFEVESGAWIKNESDDSGAIKFGHHCQLRGDIACKTGGNICVGDYTIIQTDVTIMCMKSIKIGKFTAITDGCVICDNNNHAVGVEEWIKHRIRVAPGGPGYPGLGNGWEFSESAPVKIGDAVWVGAHSTIFKGVTIGDGAIIGRGSMVTKDVPAYTLVAGNPAKVIKTLKRPDEPIEIIAQRILDRNEL